MLSGFWLRFCSDSLALSQSQSQSLALLHCCCRCCSSSCCCCCCCCTTFPVERSNETDAIARLPQEYKPHTAKQAARQSGSQAGRKVGRRAGRQAGESAIKTQTEDKESKRRQRMSRGEPRSVCERASNSRSSTRSEDKHL